MAGKYTPSEYGKRLKIAMGLAGLLEADGEVKSGAMAKIGSELGISGSAVGMVLSGQTKQFTPENSAKAARFLKVDHFWLATGEGEPRPAGLSEDAMAWARRFDKLDANGRAKFSAAIVLAQDGVPDSQVEKAMPITAKRSKQPLSN
jgi:transcriptional regulator with XRE-family HTH domain